MRNGRRDQRGSSIVEFALMGFALMIIIFGCIEFDRMLLVYTAVADSARAGARYAIVHGSNRTGTGDPASGATGYAGVTTTVKNFAGSAPLNKDALTITVQYPGSTSVTDPGNTPGSPVIVSVSYPYDPFVVLPLRVNLSSTSRGIIVF